MKFIEFTITTTNEASELVSDILWNFSGYGVAVSDVKDVLDLLENRKDSWDYYDYKLLADEKKDVLVKAYVPKEEADKASAEIRERLEELRKNAEGILSVGTLETVRREVDGDDWIEIWRKHYRPMKFGKVWICPEWIEHEPGEGEVQVKIDSNMAFGTGEHETTSMCVELLQQYVTPSSTVIDVGCGSGILGISAIKLGAKRAILTDIDLVAVRSAEHNAEINGVSDKAEVYKADLIERTSPAGDVVVANITADILIGLSASVGNYLKDKGALILSGIIHSRYSDVVKAYSEIGLEAVKKMEKGEWIAVVMKRKQR